MSHIDLRVDSNRLICDGAAGRSSTHTWITYRAARATDRVRIQARLGTTAPWGDVPLPVVMLEPDGTLPKGYRQAGRFRTPELRPGEIYQVRALLEGDGAVASAGVESVASAGSAPGGGLAIEGPQTVLVLSQDLALTELALTELAGL